MKVWTEHIRGATALVQLRGQEPLSSPLGRNIFIHLRNGIVRTFRFDQNSLWTQGILDCELYPETCGCSQQHN